MDNQVFDVFALNMVNYLNDQGYRFLRDDRSLQIDNGGTKRSQLIGSIITAAAVGVAFGALGAASSGRKVFSDENLKNDLQAMLAVAPYAGISFPFNQCYMALILNADDLSNEALIGRFSLIEESAKSMRKYGSVFVRSIVSSGKGLVVSNVLTAFSEPHRASRFSLELESNCRSMGLLSKAAVYPVAVDLAESRFIMPKLPLGDPLKLRAAKGVFA